MARFLEFPVKVCLACVSYWMTKRYSCRAISRASVPGRQYGAQSSFSGSRTLFCLISAGHFFASPISTNRRMASERETSWDAAQASRLATMAGSSRAGIVSLYLVPAGRPLDFLCTVFDCFDIIIRVHEKQAEGKL